MLAASSAAADLTQQEMQAAVEAALSNWTLSDPRAFLSYPRDASGRNLARYLLSSGSGTSATVPNSVGWWMPVLNRSILEAVSNRVDMTWTNDLARSVELLSASYEEVSNIYAEMFEIYSGITGLGIYLDGIFTAVDQPWDFQQDVHGSELLVNAPDLESGLYTLSGQLSDVLAGQSGIADAVSGSESASSNYWNQSSSSAESQGESEGESEADDDYEEGAEVFESISLPYATSSYEPSIPDASLANEDLGLSRVDVPESHNALLKLVTPAGNAPATSSGVPRVEVDFGRMAELETALDDFGDWLDWLYGVLFGVLLSAKGIAMWRVVRVATVTATAGVDPIVHLAYNPF